MGSWKKEFQYLLDRKILSADELAYLFGQIKSIIEDELDEHRWIPVGERLPEGVGVWLVLKKDGMPESFRKNDDSVLWRGFAEKYTHWKPIILPEQEKVKPAEKKPHNPDDQPLGPGRKVVDNRNLRIGERCRGKRDEKC